MELSVESPLLDACDAPDSSAPVASTHSFDDLAARLAEETNCSLDAARQAVEYIAAEDAAIGVVPTQTQVVFERFFDESGGMQLVVHAPFGGRINRAWGLAMRKRFCRSFDFELQATADDDGFILSLGPQHSFPIEALFSMLRPDNCLNLLEQAIIAVPMFHLRWRWNATRSLQVDRQRNGKKVPPALQRFRSEDLLTAVFPKLTGCQEEHAGDHVIPDHPLVRQTMHDCLHEALDIDGLIDVLQRIERGEIQLIARDTREPSPFAYELLNANPYAFLDGGEIQERRARMATTRRSFGVESVRDLGRLSPEAMQQVVIESQPLVRNADELHDVLLSRIFVPTVGRPSLAVLSKRKHADGLGRPSYELFLAQPEWTPFFHDLVQEGRATLIETPQGLTGWVATERVPAVRSLYAGVQLRPEVEVPLSVEQTWDAIDARLAVLRGLLEICGPVTSPDVAGVTGFTLTQVSAGLEALEGEGVVLRGRFRNWDALDNDQPLSADENAEWCHRRLLSRIHRLTVAGLRREIEPVEIADFVAFVCQYQGITADERRRGSNGLHEVISQLQGIDIPAIALERDILPARVEGYRREWLDELCLNGEVGWGRLYPPGRDPEKSRSIASITRIVPISLFLREDIGWLRDASRSITVETLTSTARDVLDLLNANGAMFATDIAAKLELLPTHLDEALGELVARGFVTADGFAGLRNLICESAEQRSHANGRGSRHTPRLIRHRRSPNQIGRWSVWRDQASATPSPEDPQRRRQAVEQWAWQLLRRWGVIFKDLLQKEPGAPQWWELVQVYRKLEARGEIRGGRFVRGVAGEQFAVGETVSALRRMRNERETSTRPRAEEYVEATPVQVQEQPDGESQQPGPQSFVILSASDPLNLTGILDESPRITAIAGNRVVLHQGRFVAAWEGRAWTFTDGCPVGIRQRLLQSTPQPSEATALAQIHPT